MNKIIGFIGTGNMGGALVRAAVKTIDPSLIWINNRTSKKAEDLAADTKAVVKTKSDLAKNADFLFLGVKPQHMGSMLSEIKEELAERQKRIVLVSMAAALTCEKICEMAGGDYPVIRIMPNLPVAVGEGMTLYCSRNVTEKELEEFQTVMSASGKLLEMDEKLIDAGSCVSGCGPAFVSLFVEALADGGVRCGLYRKDAQMLAIQTLLGTAKMLQESGIHPGKLKDDVCSPGGTTIAGVLALEKGAFRSDASDAVIAAFNRTNEMKG